MSIYAGIPSGAYNSEAAMLYGGLAPTDFNTETTYNLLMPWFTRNDIPEARAMDVASDVTRYLVAAADWRLNRNSQLIVEFWQDFVNQRAEDPVFCEWVRKAVNYILHKKRPSLASTSSRLAQAKTWAEALPYLRALPALGKKFPRSLLPWLRLPDDEKDLRRARWERQIGTPAAMNLPVPDTIPFVEPTKYQRDALARRKAIADALAAERTRILGLHPVIARPKKKYPAELEEIKQRARESARKRTFETLRGVFPGVTMETMGNY